MRRWFVPGLMALYLGCGSPVVEAPSAIAPPAEATAAPEAATAQLPPLRLPPAYRREPTLAMDPALQAAPTDSHAQEQEVPASIDELPESELEELATSAAQPEPPELLQAPTLETIEFMTGSRSLRARRSIAIRSEPREDAPPIGTLAQDMRVSWVQAVKGPGCDAWVQIEPRGWICERYLEGNFREPRVRELPRLTPGDLTPGVYAHVVGKRARAYPSLSAARWRKRGRRLKGSLTVRLQVELRVGRRRIWRTSDGEYIEARFLRRYKPSEFMGLDRTQLATAMLPLAWVQSRARPWAPVQVRSGASDDAPVVLRLPPRAIVSVLQTSADGRWALVSEGEWVLREELRVLSVTPPPAEAGPTGRWLDVDLAEQVLVAYEGAQPVYATLISSGAKGHETPEGLFRIWIKFAEVDMKGQAPGEGPYRVATVPWVMFFEGDFALHTSYWHDRFGEAVSHGCINLAPRDARVLYGWSAPEVPLGWSMAYATAEQAGSLVRVRRGLERAPELLVSSADAVP